VTGRVTVIRGDAAHLPLADKSVDLVMCSPPYWAQRDYEDGGATMAGQIGREPTPAAYVEALTECTAEWIRVLKPGGSIFVNLGDKYSGAQQQTHGRATSESMGEYWARTNPARTGIRAKSLMGLPWRYALACIGGGSSLTAAAVIEVLGGVAAGTVPLAEAEAFVRQLEATPAAGLGLILRAEIIWNKTNPLPESVTDRVRRQHEQLFHFTREGLYYSAVDLIRTAPVRSDARAAGHRYAGHIPGIGRKHQGLATRPNHGLGSLPGSVWGSEVIWDIPSQPLTLPEWLGVEHYAAYPLALPRRVIEGWSPPGICVECGEGRRPVAEATYDYEGRTTNGPQSVARRHESPGREVRAVRSTAIAGYVCACTPYTDHPERRRSTVTPGPELARASRAAADQRAALNGGSRHHGDDWPDREPVREYHWDRWTPAPTRPAVVLDPFGGTGTTALAALALGRDAITVDRSGDYCRAAAWRTADPGQLALAMGVPRPPAVHDGQDALFGRDELAAT